MSITTHNARLEPQSLVPSGMEEGSKFQRELSDRRIKAGIIKDHAGLTALKSPKFSLGDPGSMSIVWYLRVMGLIHCGFPILSFVVTQKSTEEHF